MSQAATRSLGTVPECWATVMPVAPSSPDPVDRDLVVGGRDLGAAEEVAVAVRDPALVGGRERRLGDVGLHEDVAAGVAEDDARLVEGRVERVRLALRVARERALVVGERQPEALVERGAGEPAVLVAVGDGVGVPVHVEPERVDRARSTRVLGHHVDGDELAVGAVEVERPVLDDDGLPVRALRGVHPGRVVVAALGHLDLAGAVGRGQPQVVVVDVGHAGGRGGSGHGERKQRGGEE